jgi:hypothetical protein
LYFMQIRNDDNRASVHLVIARQMFSELRDWNDRLYSTGDSNYGRVVLAKQFGRSTRVPYVKSPV